MYKIKKLYCDLRDCVVLFSLYCTPKCVFNTQKAWVTRHEYHTMSFVSSMYHCCQNYWFDQRRRFKTLIWSRISYRFNNSFFVLSTLVYLRFMFIFKVNTHCLSFNSTLSITNFQIQHCLHKIQFYKNYVCLGNYFKGQLFTYLSYYFLFPFVPNKSWRPYL